MQVNNGFGHTFDSVTADYDRWRPDYPAALYRDLLALCPLNEASRALEIGIGTGQATRPILETGCAVTAVEPGAQLTQFVRAKFAEYPRFQAENTRFEDFSADPGSFDLVYAATAFHWVDPEVGYPKVMALLKPGGGLPKPTPRRSRPCRSNTALSKQATACMPAPAALRARNTPAC